MLQKFLIILYAAALIFIVDACRSRRMAREEVDNPSKDLVEKYWKLDQIMDANISSSETKMPKEAFITFKNRENKIIGNFGCNSFSGTYELGENNHIHFSQLLGTLMMCSDMEVENKMKQVLEIADSYYLNNDTLVLNRARMAPLARFVAVYME